MTRIAMTFGNIVAYAELNETETARAFADKLPTTIRVSGTGIDFCGKMPFSLPYDEAHVHNGWKNGDVNYNPHGGWFAILYGGEEDSQQYDDQVVMGRLEGNELAKVQALSGSYDLLLERA